MKVTDEVAKPIMVSSQLDNEIEIKQIAEVAGTGPSLK
jgi:hypothetical protein